MINLSIHLQAEQKREAGLFEQALALYDQAIKIYQNKQQYRQWIEALCGKANTYQHLFLKRKDKSYLQKMQQVLTKIQQISQEQHIELPSFAYYYLGELNSQQKKWPQAENFFKQAVKQTKDNLAQKGNYLVHLAEAQFFNQQPQAKKQLSQGLELLKENQDQVDAYTYQVWLTGGLIKLTWLLYQSKQASWKKSLAQAEAIIKANPKLKLRASQLQELKKRLV